MSARPSHGWIDSVLLDLISYTDSNNLQEVAGKLAGAYNLLQLEKKQDQRLSYYFVGCRAVLVQMPNEIRNENVRRWKNE